MIDRKINLVSPLRYPGSKRWLSGYIKESILENKLQPDLFIEPFAGGANVSISLLKNDLVGKIGLVDKDTLISSFWRVLFFDTNWLIKKILKTEITLDEWHFQKNLNPGTKREKAFKCLFLNRTSFSGILASSAGPLGGKYQTSKYKINCRFNKDDIINRIYELSQYRGRVEFIWTLNWKTALDKLIISKRESDRFNSTLFYFDPPFYKKADSLYTHYFNLTDHLELRNYLMNFDKKWILSYDAHQTILTMYNFDKISSLNVDLIYSAGINDQRPKAKEIIISNLPIMKSYLPNNKKYSIYYIDYSNTYFNRENLRKAL